MPPYVCVCLCVWGRGGGGEGARESGNGVGWGAANILSESTWSVEDIFHVEPSWDSTVQPLYNSCPQGWDGYYRNKE